MNVRRNIVVACAVIAGVLVLAAGLAYGLRGQISLWLVQKLADRRLAEQPLAQLADGLHIGLCGAGSPFPDDRRSAPCTVIVAGQRMFMIDAGASAARNLGRMGFSPGQLEALFLTHFHSDHIDGLGELLLQRWGSAARKEPLPIYGAAGLEPIVAGIMQAYAQDRNYRVAHHGAETMPPGGFGAEARSVAPLAPDGRVVLIDEPDLQVVAFSVSHAPVHPALGYRIRYKDRTVVVSGDTVKSANVEREAKAVDLLLHEALSPRLVALLGDSAARAGRENLAKVFKDIPDYHTTPEQAAEIARDAGVGMLLLNHIVPALPLPGLEGPFLGKARDIYGGRIKLGTDGDFVSLPAGSKSISLGNRL